MAISLYEQKRADKLVVDPFRLRLKLYFNALRHLVSIEIRPEFLEDFRLDTL